MSVFLKLTRKVNDTPVLKKHHTGGHPFISLSGQVVFMGLKNKKMPFVLNICFISNVFRNAVVKLNTVKSESMRTSS